VKRADTRGGTETDCGVEQCLNERSAFKPLAVLGSQ